MLKNIEYASGYGQYCDIENSIINNHYKVSIKPKTLSKIIEVDNAMDLELYFSMKEKKYNKCTEYTIMTLTTITSIITVYIFTKFLTL
jgi:hypothetical protein